MWVEGWDGLRQAALVYSLCPALRPRSGAQSRAGKALGAAEPPAAPGNSVVLPPPRLSRSQLLRRPPGEEEAPAEMDSKLEKQLRVAFRDKLRLL